jgi:hypothetical protein
MKKILSLSLAIVVLVGCPGCYYFQSDPKAGEVWIYESDGGPNHDPLHECDKSTVDHKIISYDSVISVDDGLVRYTSNSSHEIYCSKISFFKIQAHKIPKP